MHTKFDWTAGIAVYRSVAPDTALCAAQVNASALGGEILLPWS
jgi:hypothetical protein